jgi:hypothetical protein
MKEQLQLLTLHLLSVICLYDETYETYENTHDYPPNAYTILIQCIYDSYSLWIRYYGTNFNNITLAAESKRWSETLAKGGSWANQLSLPAPNDVSDLTTKYAHIKMNLIVTVAPY